MKTSFNELKARNILSKEQMQNVKGGGTCGVVFRYADGRAEALCNLSLNVVEKLREDSSAVSSDWCCDSCGSTSYCG